VEHMEHIKRIEELAKDGMTAKEIEKVLKHEGIQNHKGDEINVKAITCILYRLKNKKSGQNKGPKPELKAIKEIPENRPLKKSKYAVIITDREGIKDLLGGLL